MLYVLLPPTRLILTKEVNFDGVADLQATILRLGRWTVPITAEKNALFVMDGHHRLSGETVTLADIFAMARAYVARAWP